VMAFVTQRLLPSPLRQPLAGLFRAFLAADIRLFHLETSLLATRRAPLDSNGLAKDMKKLSLCLLTNR